MLVCYCIMQNDSDINLRGKGKETKDPRGLLIKCTGE